MPDFAARRVTMVDTQIRPSDVTKYPVIAAMLDIPRERFVPKAMTEAAYAGQNIELAPGRVLLEARTFAKMLDALDVRQDELVLDIGCGLGYSSAVIARMAEAVVALEEDSTMAAEAEATLADLGVDTVAVITGPLADGSAKHGPFDAIIVQGGVETLPEAIISQLKDGGRIVAIFIESALGVVRVGTKSGQRIIWRDTFNAGAPVVPGFAHKAEFVL
jgi:protein-L-isoaspartate(D-aspartate) O-methyltransferase